MAACRACLHDNPPAQRYCGACGTLLAEPTEAQPGYTPSHLEMSVLKHRAAIEGEHKLVSVVFCDIANSTPLAAARGAEAMHVLLDRFFKLALEQVHRYQGTINQFLGDGFMALFGAPTALENHARCALHAALGLRRRLQKADGADAPLAQLALRIGVNTGAVVVGKIGDDLRADYTAIGDTTHLAARLQQLAGPGTICVGETTWRAAEPHFEFRALGHPALKGIVARGAVYELLGVRPAGRTPAAATMPGRETALVGRAGELDQLIGALEALVRGRGGAVVLRGEAGLGKSRLLGEARRSSAALGVRWLTGGALTFGRGLSYWPFIEILKACFEIADNASESAAWGRLDTGLRELFGDAAVEIGPYLATVLALETPEELRARVQYLDAQALRSQVLLSMRRLFEALARRTPTLLVFEDWHWSDPSSIALCEHLLPLARDGALGFWFVTRREPAEPIARIEAAAASLALPQLLTLELTPLHEADSRTMIEHLVGAFELPAELRRSIFAKTDGNPFFIEELMRGMVADGTLAPDPDNGGWCLTRALDAVALPDTVQAVILARIDKLEDAVKSVLKLASVIGRTFLRRVLEAIGEGSAIVDGGLARLESAELVRLHALSPELEYVFKHALVQEAVYGTILGERRRAIHRSVAQAIERLFADRLDEFIGLLAYHYALAQEWPQAQAYLSKAADQAGRMASDAEALEHYRQAEAAYMQTGAPDLTPLQRAQLDRKLGQALYGIGHYEQAVLHLTRALDHLGLPYPRARWGVRAELAYLSALHFARRLPGWPRAAPLGAAEGREVSIVCQSLAWLDYFVDENRLAFDALIELRAGERSGDPIAHAHGLAIFGLVLMSLRAWGLARRLIDEALAIARAAALPGASAMPEFVSGWWHWARGATSPALQALDRSIVAYTGIGEIRRTRTCFHYRCWIALQFGQLDEARRLALETLQIGVAAADPHVESWGLLALGVIDTATGPLDAAVAHLDEAYRISERISSLRAMQTSSGHIAKCRLRQGRLVEAHASIRTALVMMEKHSFGGLWSCDTTNTHAEICLHMAEGIDGEARRDALRVAARACKRAVRCSEEGLLWRPEALRLHGTLACLEGDMATARSRWHSSLTLATRFGMRLEYARTLREVGVRTADVALLNQARQVFEAAGAVVDIAAIQR